MLDRLKDRYFILSMLTVLFAVVVTFQLVVLQVINGNKYDEQSQKCLLTQRDIIPPRGNIFDRNGVSIAGNRISFVVEIIKTDINNSELNEMLLKLVNIFEKNHDFYDCSLNKYLTFNPLAFGQEIKNSGNMDKWRREMISKRDSNVQKMKNPLEAFDYFRDTKFSIKESYTDEEAYKIMTLRYEILIRGYNSLNPIIVANNVSREAIAEIEESSNELPGVSIDVEPIRQYNFGSIAAHVVGYVANISSEEYKNKKDENYKLNDIIGKFGIELEVEKYLRGQRGQKRVEVDIHGRMTKESVASPSIPGNDVTLTLDINLQKVATESLSRNIDEIKKRADYKQNFGDAFAGAVVAMDVNTGEILAMDNYPSFDPSIYLASQDDRNAQKEKIKLLTDDTNTPFLNRAIQGMYTPGSTYKPIIAIAGLEEDVITRNTIIRDNGVITIGNKEFFCLEYKRGLGAHGDLTLERALATSCNIFFHELGVRIGIDKIDKWAHNLGLGELTGIDLQGEEKGVRSNPETKKKYHNGDIWRPADTAQASIGQFDNLLTPIQLANYMSILANNGKKFKPYLLKKVTQSDGNIIMQTQPSFTNVPIKQETLDAVKKGMIAVTNSMDGTAVQAFQDFPFKVAGKTWNA